MQDDATYQRMNFTFDGEPSVFEFPVVSLGKQPLAIEGFSAHWLDSNTLVWNADFDVVAAVKLHHSSTAGIEADENDNVSGTQASLTNSELSDEQKSAAPLVADWPALAGDWSVDDAKAMLKEQLVLVGYNSENKAVAATYVQADLILDELFTKGDNDADEATLGVVYDNGNVAVSVWSPTAQKVVLKVYDANKTLTNSYDMNEDSATGIWSYQGDSSLDRQYYHFELTLYHPQNKAIEVIESTDPYSVSLSANGEYSQFVNLTDAD
jgi:pullulanase